MQSSSVSPSLAHPQDLVAMRQQNQWPEDPLTHLKDYFGNMRSPEWDVMDQLQEENELIREELPSLQDTIVQLGEEIELEKRKTRIYETYRAINVDGSVSFFKFVISQNAIGMKSIVQKLSGFAKFELDHKLGVEHFHAIAMKLAMVKDTLAEAKDAVKSGLSMSAAAQSERTDKVFSKERLEQVLHVFSRAYKDNVVPF